MTKQDAIETIRMALAQVEWEYPMDYAVAFDMAVEALNQPEIVRCKDCRHNEILDGNPICKIKYGWFPTKPDWFCADGKAVERE